MRYSNIRNADLNLLVSFQVLMEERSVTRAAHRMFLSQPAMSRAIDRLQELFKDELLVRTCKGYEPTHRALEIYAELEQVFPKIEGLLERRRFDPGEVKDVFRIDAADSMTLLFVSKLMEVVARDAPGIRIELMVRTGFGRLETNDSDLVLATDREVALWIGKGVQTLNTEPLLQDKLACLVRSGHPLASGRLTLARYLKAQHIAISSVEDTLRTAVSFIGEPQRSVASMLDRLGKKREVRMSLPFGLPVGRVVENTDLVATISYRVAQELITSKTRIIPAPIELRGALIHSQVWHPRNSSNALHKWLRTAMREVAAQIAQSLPNPPAFLDRP